MGKAQRPIDPADFTAIPRTRELIKSLPEEIRVCSEHGEEVTIRESEFLPNPGAGAPFAKAAFVGCCDTAINKVLESIRKAQIKQ
jgi:hypothetical protein